MNYKYKPGEIVGLLDMYGNDTRRKVKIIKGKPGMAGHGDTNPDNGYDVLDLDKGFQFTIEERRLYSLDRIKESNLIKRVEKLLNESEVQIYNVEYNYGDGSPGLAIGHVKVRANSEEEALEKAEKYASNRHYRDDSYYIEDSCKIVKSGYSNDPIIESSQKDLANHLLQVLSKGGATLRQLQDFERNGYSDKDLSDTLKDLIQQKKIKTSFEGGTTRYILVESQKNEADDELLYFTYTKDKLKTEDDFNNALKEMKKAFYEEPNLEAKFIIDRDMAIVKTWKNALKFNSSESSQKSEDLSKHPKLKDVWSRWKFNTKYGLHYTSNAKDTQAYLAKITKPNTFWLEDEDTGEAIVQGTPKNLIDFMLKHKDKIDESIDQDLKSSLKTYLDQTEGKFEDIPDRNNVDWKNVSDNALSDYERLGLQLFNKKKAHDSFAYSVVKSVLDNNLDGAVIDWIKVHMEETPEIAKALKEFDDALQEKDLTKSWKAYQNLWDVHRNATKRKYTKKDIKNESVTYHFSVEDIGISGNNWVFPEEAYEEAKSRLSKLGYKVSDLTDDLEFTVIGDSTGVAYDGVIYSKEDANESVSEGNLGEIYKVLDYYMTKLGFNLIEDRKPYFMNKKYIKADNTNYIHYIDFTPQMDNDQLKYEVRDEKGHQKLCNTYNILDAVDMDTSLKLIEFDMEGLE